MAYRERKGNVCAYIKEPGMDKGKYVKVGIWFQDDGDDGRISMVIDALPLPHTAWKGWLNLFKDEGGSGHASHARESGVDDDNLDSDIPF